MRIGLIGAGNMARAMARGWGEPVLCSDGGSGRAAALASELGGRAASNLEVAREADLVVLCHKPAQLESVAEEIRDEVRCLASVLGPTTVAELQAAYPGASVFRMMPNTPVEIGQGVVCYAPASGVDAELEREVVGEFERLGSVLSVPERLISAASGISGVGPAYQALLAEAQMDAGVRHGLSPGLAGRLVAETMSGSAALLKERGFDTLAVRREVTSPGGSTARGLAALERARLRDAFQAAMDAVCGEPGR
jgi:pyrroline-5-carboxylate reductase